jgi:hypothetical protein
MGLIHAALTLAEKSACMSGVSSVTADNQSLYEKWRNYYATVCYRSFSIETAFSYAPGVLFGPIANIVVPLEFGILRMNQGDYDELGIVPETGAVDWGTSRGRILGTTCRSGPNQPVHTCSPREWLDMQPEFLTLMTPPPLLDATSIFLRAIHRNSGAF